MRTWLLAGALAALIGSALATGATPAVAATFPDVETDHWAYEAVDYLQDKGLVAGFPDGEFKGDKTLTRYEFAMALARLHEKLLVIIGEGGVPAADEEAIYQRLVDEFGADIEEIRAMVDDHGERLGEMESAFGQLSTRLDGVDKAIADRLGTVKMSADLRTRIEIIDPDDEDANETKRARIRLRVKGEGKINDEMTGTFRVATGGEGQITSTNESLEDHFAMDPFDLDQAYLTWTPKDQLFDQSWKLTAGKFAPTWKSTLMTYDSDTNVEGLGWNFLTDNKNWKVNLAQLQPSNVGIYLVNQVGYEGLFDAFNIYATYHHMDDKAFSKWQADASSTTRSPRLVNEMFLGEIADHSNFRQWEVLATADISELFNMDYALKLTGNYLQSSYDPIAGMNERATEAGYARLDGGTILKNGDWNWFAEWGRTLPNALITQWTDSDRGEGNTEFVAGGVTYRWMKNIDLGVTVIDWNRYWPESDDDGALRVQLDAVAKF